MSSNSNDGDPFRELSAEDDIGADELFEEKFSGEAFSEIETDELWREIEAQEPRQTQAGAIPDDANPNIHIVPKHSYCENCEHFSQPPDIACLHDGTDIMEFIDRRRVKVRNCPIVEERGEETRNEERSVTSHPGARK